MDISLCVSPDADDLFMVRALLEGQLDTGPYRFHIGSSPTDALNRLASGEDPPDVLAVSIAHYPFIADRYQLLPHGGSMGEGYGPVVVSRREASLGELHERRLAIPGETTTAWLVLRLLLSEGVQPVPVRVSISPHERVFEALEQGEVDFALLIHEGRLTYESRGLSKVLDLGEGWAELTPLPLPLGGNVIRRSLGEQAIREISSLLRQSIAWALQDREGSIDWLLARGGALRTREEVSRYLSMYANTRTLDYGEDGRQAIRWLLERAAQRGLVPSVPVDFAP
jgi:1,4-dihydroxy-6-naphthoate synthase